MDSQMKNAKLDLSWRELERPGDAPRLSIRTSNALHAALQVYRVDVSRITREAIAREIRRVAREEQAVCSKKRSAKKRG